MLYSKQDLDHQFFIPSYKFMYLMAYLIYTVSASKTIPVVDSDRDDRV